MKTRGTIVQLERRPGDPTPLAFWLVTGTEKIPVESATDGNFANGETVEVSGVTNSDGTLIAASIGKVRSEAGFPWKPVLAFVLVLVAGIAAYLLLRPRADSTYSAHLTKCLKVGPNIVVLLTDANKREFTCTTDVEGNCAISKLAAGTYTVQAGGSNGPAITMDGKTSYGPITINVAPTSPCLVPFTPRISPNAVKLPEAIKK
jgi:hypothetical protein